MNGSRSAEKTHLLQNPPPPPVQQRFVQPYHNCHYFSDYYTPLSYYAYSFHILTAASSISFWISLGFHSPWRSTLPPLSSFLHIPIFPLWLSNNNSIITVIITIILSHFYRRLILCFTACPSRLCSYFIKSSIISHSLPFPIPNAHTTPQSTSFIAMKNEWRMNLLVKMAATSNVVSFIRLISLFSAFHQSNKPWLFTVPIFKSAIHKLVPFIIKSWYSVVLMKNLEHKFKREDGKSQK